MPAPSFAPEPMKSHRQGSGMNCPYAGQESVSRASQCWGEMLHTCVSCILFWRHWNCKRRTARASFRFTLTLGPFFPIPWLACFQLSHVSSRPHASHFSASGAAAGPRAGHPRGHRCNCNTPRGDHHPLLCSSRPTGHHPPSVCTCTVPHPSPLSLIMDEPPARERGTSAWPE